MTGNEAAALLGISRRSLYRWADEGRVSIPFNRTQIEASLHQLGKRRRGPVRNPRSKRYTIGRHRFVI